MRCPKCGFISYDDLAACAKCTNDLSALSQELQGTCTEARVGFFLAPAIKSSEFIDEEAFSDSQALPTFDEGDLTFEDTGTSDVTLEDDVEIELGDVMPIDLDQLDTSGLDDEPFLEETGAIDQPSEDQTVMVDSEELEDISFDDLDAVSDDELEDITFDDLDSEDLDSGAISLDDDTDIDLDITGTFSKEEMGSDTDESFADLELDETTIIDSPPVADLSSTDESTDLDLDEDLLAELAGGADDDLTEAPVPPSQPSVELTADETDDADLDLDEDLLAELAGADEEPSSPFDETGETLSLGDASSSSELGQEVADLDDTGSFDLDAELEDDTELDSIEVDEGMAADLDEDADVGSLDLDDIDVTDLLSSDEDAVADAADDEVDLASLMDASAEEDATGDIDLDMLEDDDIPEIDLVEDDEDEGAPS